MRVDRRLFVLGLVAAVSALAWWMLGGLGPLPGDGSTERGDTPGDELGREAR